MALPKTYIEVGSGMYCGHHDGFAIEGQSERVDDAGELVCDMWEAGDEPCALVCLYVEAPQLVPADEVTAPPADVRPETSDGGGS